MTLRHQLALALALFLLGAAGGRAEEDAAARVAALEAQGESRQYAGDLAGAEAAFRSALEVGEAGDPGGEDSLLVAGTLVKLGNVLRLQKRAGEAADLQRRALEIRERLAPDSLEVADSLHQLFVLAYARNDLDGMVALSRRALGILERRGPGTLAMADALNDVAYIALFRAEFHKAAESYGRALEILERQAPGSIQLATLLSRRGRALMLLGDPEAAEESLRQALAIREKRAPESLGTAVVLTILGALARDRGNLDSAEELARRALEISGKVLPDGIEVAENLNLLGTIALKRGDAAEAWSRHSRALAIFERIGHPSAAADTLGFLGLAAEARNDFEQALGLQRRSKALRHPPATIRDAVTLHRIGLLQRRLGRRDEAARSLAEAVEILESQVGRLGPQEVQAEYRAQHEEIYRDAIEVELESGRPGAAFHLVERSRARSFLALLAERDLEFRELPAELAQSRRDNSARYDRALAELADWTPKAGEEAREALRRDLERLRRERDEIAERIRAASPRVAELRQPQPLDLDAARRVLDPGTLALSYSVGREKTALFALTQDGLKVEVLPVGEEKLRRDVESFLERVRSQGKPDADLYRALIAPVAALVERSERVLILPDGPLHRLPFGALVQDGGRFLVESKPVHTALSLTVYGKLRASAPSSGKLVAFGDPRFPKDMQAKKTGLGPGLRSFDWSSLPYSRREVEQIAGVHPGALLYLGEEATEERARSIHDARILHFATHGYTDDRTPLDSALVLTIPEEPGRENGLLQVWEIFEGVRIDAGLVVLSACESALGRELSGEGLIGLTRAFQYAGARSVAASLWSVADQVTAELMTRFHRHLAAGLHKDQALRAAQLELIREPIGIATASGQAVEMDASAPFFWAAFQLFGDWKSEDPKARVAELEAQAESAQNAGRLVEAEARYRSALEAGEAAWGDSLAVAATLSKLGLAVRLQGRIDEAKGLQERALAIRERLAPDSLEVADSLHQLFFVAFERGDMEGMAGLVQRAQTILEGTPADSLAMADHLADLGILESERGRHAEAVAYFERALAIQESKAPDSLALSLSLTRLGLISRVLGEPRAAEEWLQRALAIQDRLAPESLATASTLNNLGHLVRERGDLNKAAELIGRAVKIAEKSAPQGNAMVAALNGLGAVERMRGNLDRAWELHQRALEMRKKAPGRADETAYPLMLLGQVAEDRGDLDKALDLQQQALAAGSRAVPGGLRELQALQHLARLHRRMGRAEQGAQLLARAIDTLESQTARLGGTRNLQTAFRARHEEIYQDAVEIALERKLDAEAFHLLERSRARSFLALLAERSITLGELPAELVSSRRDVATRYDQKLRELTQAEGEAKERLQRELDHLREERDQLTEKIRAASPRLASLREPRPLDLDAARKVLDAGTLALSYSVGKDKTVLFALTPEGGLQVKTLPIGREKLRAEVESFLGSVRSQGKPAADLHTLLIGPVADLVERSERVLILPDGPLHRLPFGALAHNGHFLIEEKPLHTALSLTVYGTLRASGPAARPASRPAAGTTKLVAFGDPRFPKGMPAKSDLGPGLRSFDWASLPYSRREVESIAGVHPGARVYLGAEATEERAKAVQGARILHFATHGYTDDRAPLDSALVLTIPEKLAPGGDNGLLQVWEIFESVRLDADLVVLSACESALGRELSGEGLIGLTRAFQYAGARSVTASLWSVADQVTAELMARFHRHLALGLPKDQALRAAQLELIRKPVEITTAKGQKIEMDASAPFFWAAFQVFGDWK